MELIERIDLDRVYYLQSFSFKDFQTFLTSKKSLDEQKKLFDKIKNLAETVIKTRGETKRIYSYSLSTPLEVGGRLFCGNSVQGIPKAFRGFLMGHSTTDIDMKNAHPTILQWLCNDNNIHCPNLTYYNSRRDEILSVFDDRDKAKELFLKAVNDDKINKKETNKLFKDFDKEMKNIQKQLLDLPKFEYVKNSVPEHKNYNFYGSAINRLLCVYENKILQSVISVINKKNIEISVLMFDGLMVYGNHYDNLDLLYEIENKVAQDFSGLEMKFAYKSHDVSIQMPKDFVIPDKSFNRFASNDDEASDILFDDLKDSFKAFKGRMFYLNDNIWICEQSQIDDFVLNFILKSKIYEPDKDGCPKSFVQNVSRALKVREALYCKIRGNNNDPDLYHKFHKTTKAKLCFNDGVLDLKTKTFTLWADVPKQTVFSTIKINYDYYEYFKNPNISIIDTIKKDVFEPMFGENLDIALKFLARAMAGHNEDKNFATYLGNRNCGKGVLYDLLKFAFQNYVSTFELGNMLYCRKTAGMENVDCSKKLYWLLDLEFARLAVSQEVPDESSGLYVNGKMLKKITGGGDEIVARRNYDRFDTHFTSDISLFIFGNSDLMFDSNDCNETRISFTSVVQFKSEQEINMMRDEKRSELEMTRYRIRNEKIKEITKTNEWKMATIALIAGHYNDKPVEIVHDVEIDETKVLLQQIQSLFEFNYGPDKETDEWLIPTKVLYSKLSDYGAKKIKTELNSMNIFDKKIKRDCAFRDKHCFVGIKLKSLLVSI
jgi:hypothetical protein